MSKQLYVGMGLGALPLFILIGAGVYVSSNSERGTGEPQDVSDVEGTLPPGADTDGQEDENNPQPFISGETVVVEGTVTCLPHKGDGPQTMECAFGLQAVTGEYYGLSNLWTIAPDVTDTGAKVEVRGEFVPPAANEKYDIQGYIDVQSV